MFFPLFLLVAAQNSTAAPTQSPRHEEVSLAPNILELAILLNPEKERIEVAVRGFQVGFEEALRQNPEQAAVFEEYPGLEQAIIAEVRPVIEAHVRKGTPRIRARYGRFYQAKLTSAEIDQLLGFYRTATGAKLIAGMFAGVDLSALTKKVVQREDEEVRATDLRTAVEGAVNRVLPAFDEQDKAALLTFMRTPAFSRIRELNPEIMALHAELANEADPELDEAVDRAIEPVIDKFIAKQDAAASTG